MSDHIKVWTLASVCAAIVGAVLFFVPPIPQNPAYHLFADQRGGLGIPNFGDVVSNLLFVPAGLYGLWVLGPRKAELAYVPLAVFFFSLILVAAGSAYYHWNPDNSTLFWDRLPMTVAFSGFTAAVIADRIDAKAGVRYALPVLIVIGVASVIYWRWAEAAGAGDLRAYGLVQFLPMLAIPLMLWLFPSKTAIVGWRAILAVFIFYGLAKGAEHFDRQILDLLGGAVSGHTLKHVFAAIGPVALVMNLRLN